MAIKVNKNIVIEDTNKSLNDLVNETSNLSTELSSVKSIVTMLNQALYNMKHITLNAWYVGTYSNGDGFKVHLPITNPNNTQPTINLTTARYFDGNGTWQTLSLSPSINYYNTNEVCLYWNSITGTRNIGNTYLVNLVGTITCQ